MKVKIARQAVKKSLRQYGQGMTEYIIIVALIAVAAIGVYSMFGQTIRGQVAGLAGEVAGTGASAGKSTASTAAGNAATKAAEGKGMASYDSGNAPSSGGTGGGTASN
ncbi:MAG TPA: pilus assembly protein [Oxalicibacterium sp.]|jgi:Flp pilus assembly pilin Flp|nr:pilus assembly protein [Oxalicibacterium sp.]